MLFLVGSAWKNGKSASLGFRLFRFLLRFVLEKNVGKDGIKIVGRDFVKNIVKNVVKYW